MRNSLRAFVLVLFFTALGATTASGQTFELYADQSQLTPQGGEADAHCIVQISTGTLVFFNSTEGGIYTWDGSNLGVHTSPSQLNSNISGESNTINRCDAAEVDGSDNVFFSFRNDNSGTNYVYQTEAANPSNFNVKELDGINGLAASSSTLYLANVAGFDDTNTRSNGIYSIAKDLSGSVQEIATNPDVELSDAIALSSSGILYSFSLGSGNFEDIIVSLDPEASTPAFQLFVDPYQGGTLSSGQGGSIADVEVVDFQGETYIVVFNNSFRASNGEEFGTIRVSDQQIDILFTQDDLVNNVAGISGYDPGFTEPLFANASGEVFVTSADRFGATDYIARVSGAPPLPVELTAFTVETDAQQAVLTWTTATETNNAGFEVQHQAPGAASWSQIGFEQGAGTTTEARSYRFATDALQPGVHTFRLRQVDTDGTESFSDTRRVEIAAAQAVAFAGPNPVSAGDRARVTVQLDRAQDVTVSIYNVLGQQVDQLHRGTLQAGEVLETSVSTGNLPSGMYFLRVQGTSVNEVKKFTVVK